MKNKLKNVVLIFVSICPPFSFMFCEKNHSPPLKEKISIKEAKK